MARSRRRNGRCEFSALLFFQRPVSCRAELPTSFIAAPTPKIMRIAINLHKYLIQMPLPVRVCAHLLNSFAADLSSEHRAKSVPPEPNGFMADFNAPFMQQIFDVAQRKRKSNVHHHGKANDFWAAVKILEGVIFCHPERLRDQPARLNPNPSDKTLVADIDATFVQQVFHIPKRQRKSHVQHHRQADDFGIAVKALERV